MRITDALAARRAYSPAATQAAAAFSLPRAQAAPLRAATAPAMAMPLESVAPATAMLERRRGIRRGKALLGALDRLKLALLSGAPVTAALDDLATESRDATTSGDSALDAILSAIRLRAEVELAKAEAARGGQPA